MVDSRARSSPGVRQRARFEPGAPRDFEAEIRILQQVAKAHGMTVDAMLERCRIPALVRARGEVAYRLQQELNYRARDIADVLMLDAHATIQHGIAKHKKRIGL
jgi:chromosomal replication initiation ATPase DnaA